MYWNKIKTEADLRHLRDLSEEGPVLLFKSSPRCSISAVVGNRLDTGLRESADVFTGFFVVDVVSDRPLSQTIAEEYGVRHESPQTLIISRGSCIYHASHFGVQPGALLQQAQGIIS